MDKLARDFAENWPTLMLVVGQFKEKLRVNWNIPATWIIGSAAIVLLQAAVVIVQVSSMISDFRSELTATRAMLVAQQSAVGTIQVEQRAQDVTLARHDVLITWNVERMNLLLKRIELAETIAREFFTRKK